MARSNLGAECSAYIRDTRLEHTVDKNGRRWLVIPGHVRIPSHATEKLKTLFRDRKPEFYEQSATLLLSFLFSKFKPSAFFDIGAAYGYFSRVAASNLTAAPTAHAFDMRPQCLAELEKQNDGLDLPGRIVAHAAGLSDTHGGEREIWFARTKMFEYEPSEAEYREAWHRRLKFFLKGDKSRGLHKTTVLLTSLDRFCADRAVRPGLMKIDVDGYEGPVIKGAHDLLGGERPPLILLELHRDKMQRDGFTRSAVVAPIFAAGYEALFLTDHHDAEKCELVSAGPDHPLFERQETDMILFVPKWA